MRRNRLDHLPVSTFGWRPLVWVGFAGVVCASLLFGFEWGAGRVVVPQAEVFVGTLRPEREVSVVRLPAEVPLLSVLVEPGEPVRKGQTVALLDQAAIESRLVQIEREVKSNAIFRECLLAPKGFQDDTVDASGYDAETQLLIREAVDACQAVLRRHDLDATRLTEIEDLLRKRIDLIEKNLTLVLRAEQGPEDQAHQALDFALQKNRLQERLAQLKAELHKERLAFDTERRDLQTDAAEKVAQLRHQRAILTRFNKAPRLTAPQSGTVARVRPLLTGSPYHEVEELIELHDERHDSFEAEFAVSLKQAHALREGMDVSFRLLGYPQDGPVLHGHISALQSSEDPNAQVIARIALDQDSLKRLADPAGGIALKGQSTASAIHVSLADQTLSSALAQAVAAVVPTPAYKQWSSHLKAEATDTDL